MLGRLAFTVVCVVSAASPAAQPGPPPQGGPKRAQRAANLAHQRALEHLARKIRAAVARARGATLPVDPGPNARIERLIPALAQNDTTRMRAAQILARRGPKARAALPALVLALEHSRATPVRAAIAAAMIKIDPDHPSVAPAQIYRLCNGTELARRDACMALGRQGAATPAVLLALLTAIDDRSLRVAREAVTALGMLGPAARRAAPWLQKKTTHPDKQIRERAKAALGQIRDR